MNATAGTSWGVGPWWSLHRLHFVLPAGPSLTIWTYSNWNFWNYEAQWSLWIFERRESKDASFWCLRTLLWGLRHFFTLSCAGRSGEDWSGLSGGPCPQMWFMLQTRIAWVAADVCMYIRMYIYTYIYIICIRFIVSVYNDLATEGYLARICLYTWGSSTFVRGECGGVRFWARFWICSASIFFHIVSHHSVLLGSYDFIWQGSWAVSIRIWILFWQAARLVAGDAGLTVATLAGKGAAQAFKELLYDLKNDLLLCLFWSSDFM